MPAEIPRLTSAEIAARRPARNPVDPERPYAFFSEPEVSSEGDIVQVATLFLVNRECPFKCVMCDLWKKTLEASLEPGFIPRQISRALERLPSAEMLKLYNSGNFFDRKAIPREDYREIAPLVRGFDSVIVENHPKLCGPECLRFRDLIAPARLEIALGLETIHPDVLPALNKEMTVEDFDRAVEFLHTEGIRTRAFVLVNPPFLPPEHSVEWAAATIRHAFDRGVSVCSAIATRTGNGIMEDLQRQGYYHLPRGTALENVMRRGLADGRGRVFVDLWEADGFFPCNSCRADRMERLREMNLSQSYIERTECEDCGE